MLLLGVGLQHGKLFDGTHIFLTWVNSFAGDMMHKVHYLCLEEGALGWFQFQIEFSEAFNTTHKLLKVFFFCAPEDDNIIQIDDAIGQIELSQCILH